MDEQRARLKMRRKRRLRALAVALCVCVLFTTYPNILETISALAAGSRGEDAPLSITGFAGLPEDVREQTVPLGTAIEELNLPDTLEASVAPKSAENEGGGVKPAEDTGKTPSDEDDDDKNPDEGDESGDDTPGDGGDGESGNIPGDGEGGNGGDTPAGGDNGGRENPDGGENGASGDGGNTGSENSGASDDNGDQSSPDGGNGGADTDAPASSDSASGRAAVGLSVETGSFAMPVYASGNTEDTPNMGTLTAAPDGGADSADTTAAPADETADRTGAREKTVAIENVTWESDPAYDGDTEGVYTFTPVLPEGYVLSEGVSLPKITVTVEFQGEQLTPEQYAQMMAGLQDDPVLLTEEDIFADDPSLAAQAGGRRRAAERAAANLHPGTYLTTDDNEDNAGTGNPDGDLDRYLNTNYSQHPIEANIMIPEGELPTKDCYIAVRTYDVDWRGASKGKYAYAEKEGGKVAVRAETVIKSTKPNATYDTEYSIADSKGFIVGSY